MLIAAQSVLRERMEDAGSVVHLRLCAFPLELLTCLCASWLMLSFLPLLCVVPQMQFVLTAMRVQCSTVCAALTCYRLHLHTNPSCAVAQVICAQVICVRFVTI